MGPPTRRTPPGEGGVRQISCGPDQRQAYRFTCPSTGMELDSPPLSDVLDAGHRLVAANADHVLLLAVERIRWGNYREAAARLRAVADRLDCAQDALDAWAQRQMEVAA